MLSMPSWDRIHPLIVHFPIALLLFVPFVALAALFFKRMRLGLFVAALIMILAGTITAYLAFSSGQAAESAVKLSHVAHGVVELHEESAKKTRNIFTLVTALYCISLAIGVLSKSGFIKAAGVALGIATVAVYIWGALSLINTGHLGARLVHDLGVHNPITQGVIDYSDSGDNAIGDGESGSDRNHINNDDD